jgi:3-oxoacyl-[acyl-carrier protein] reductase
MGLCVVSGAGSGLGRACALRLAADGHRVIAVGRRAEMLDATAADAAEGAIVAVSADLATPDGARAVAAKVAEAGEPLDGIVAAAGGRGPYGSPDDSLEEIVPIWQVAFDMNVKTAVLLVEALVPHLRRPGGAIVLFSSLGVWIGTGLATYAGAKGALHGYTAGLATRLGPEGITANTIAPGFVPDTEFFGEAGLPEPLVEKMIAETPLRRAGEPDDIASLASWLVTENRFTTGQVISANGGAGIRRG